MSLLSGARNAKHSNLAGKIYDRMKQLFPDSSDPLKSAEVLLGNVYASSGDIEKASNIRRQSYHSGTKKKIGLSSTVINGQLYVIFNFNSSIVFNHSIF